ncbi:ThrRS/AlaRS common domain-containing protein [Amniculicola lignicola CBS 123094]|uniref:ThrRS/AlaRS common domain-containing protein n=1 Tax=Amniculicola lignicola CBS 123094 TaxID=1392246 RepID=A0A6A5WZS0_9PLEO|nr:ThrRS/AlaRS common domain-containing protein [Amniculicola lignicola CBS 123094]
MAVAGPVPAVVGALHCQKDSYSKSLETKVISCTEYTPPKPSQNGKGKPQKKSTDPDKAFEGGTSTPSKAYLIELEDSVLFPEGGGQPTDHGSLTPLDNETPESIPITYIQRHGLRCVHWSPQPLEPGTSVRQDVDFTRRWDHMQQHTGQHLLSAIMDKMDLETLGWGMGAAGEMNYVELPRKPTASEIADIQNRCNETIRSNMPITVETPDQESGKSDSLPDDYDKERGVVRYIRIGDLDYNACCGTHLQQTSHVQVIFLHHTQTIRGTNCRLYFTCGERAIQMASEHINTLRAVAGSLSCSPEPLAFQANIKRLTENLSEGRKREKKLLAEIAGFEGERLKRDIGAGKNGWCYRATDGLDFTNLVWTEVKDLVKERGVVVLVSGQEKGVGGVMIVGQKELVERLSAKVKEVVSSVKGGGKGEKWQGKVVEWKKGEIEALREAVEG